MPSGGCSGAHVQGGERLTIRARRVGSHPALLHQLSDKKRQSMAASADFLGLVHNLASTLAEGTLTLWPRQTLSEKLQRLLLNALENNSCTPAEASKIRGAGFMDLCVSARAGRAGMGPLLQ